MNAMDTVRFLILGVFMVSGWILVHADQECEHCNNVELCNTTSGVCNGSCSEGWNGIKCDEPIELQVLDVHIKFAIAIVAVVTGSVFLILAFSLICCCACRKKKQTLFVTEASSEFDKLENPTDQLRKLQESGNERNVRSINTVCSWGSEFPADSDKDDYVNVSSYKTVTNPKYGSAGVYANTLPVPQTDCKKTLIYVNAEV